MNMNMVTMAMGRYFSQLNDNQSILKSAIKNCAKKMICKSANFSKGQKSLIPKLVRYYDNYYLLKMFIIIFFFFFNSLTAGLLIDDNFDLLTLEDLLESMQNNDCKQFSCFSF